jgi:two-component system cell cycle response regulator
VNMVPETVTPLEGEQSERRTNRVLIAEDDPMFRKILTVWLGRWGYRVMVAEDGTAAWNLLQQDDAPELLILDWVMPGIDGPELCRRIRRTSCMPYQYILLVTARNESQDVVNGLEAGADDYLTKPFDQNELRARLRVGNRILALQADLIESREKLRFQATHDGLTGLWNRSSVLDMLHREMDRANRNEGFTGVLMLDLDHFKRVNDKYGHQAGDAVLKSAADRIAEMVRPYDIVGRYGGEEFLVVLPNCDIEQSRQTAERICAAVGDVPILLGNREIRVTVSIGVTACAANTFQENQLLAIADIALYKAKDAGRNCVFTS